MKKLVAILAVLLMTCSVLVSANVMTDEGVMVDSIHPQPVFPSEDSSSWFLSITSTCKSKFDNTCNDDGSINMNCYADDNGDCRCYRYTSSACSSSGSDAASFCWDGTPVGECSSNKPRYCQDFGSTIGLVNDAGVCGCPSGYVSNSVKECVPVTESFDCYIGTQGYDSGEIVCGAGGNAIYSCFAYGDLELQYACSRGTSCSPYSSSSSSSPLCCPDYCGNGCYSDNTCKQSLPDDVCSSDVDCPFHFFCVSGACNERFFKEYEGCYSGDVWWYDNFDIPTEISEYCGEGFCDDSSGEAVCSGSGDDSSGEAVCSGSGGDGWRVLLIPLGLALGVGVVGLRFGGVYGAAAGGVVGFLGGIWFL